MLKDNLCTLWAVSDGSHLHGSIRWFSEERLARQYANELFEIEVDGIPFVTAYPFRDTSELVKMMNAVECQ